MLPSSPPRLLRICRRLAWLAILAAGQAAAATPADREDWIALFDGRDLDGWTPKITGHALGENFADTFRVEDGLLKVRYDGYASFDGQFGHLFHRTPYAYYRLVVEYRFVGEQAPGGPDWALRNSGAMLHAQDPRTMRRDQDFPISIEAQFLGGLGDGEPRPTLNLCTPGTDVVLDGALLRRHCLESASKTIDGERWVRAEMVVLGGAQIAHLVDGERVLQYAMPQAGSGGVEGFDPAVQRPDGTPLERGYIALQSESHPIDIRKVELLDLAGCMDPEAVNYRRYFVKSEPGRCRYAGARARDARGD